MLLRRLSYQPLALLRRDLDQPRTTAPRLSRLPLTTRLRLRRLLHAPGSSLLALAGIALNVFLLVMGLGIQGSIQAYADTVRQEIPFAYLYVLDRSPAQAASQAPGGAPAESPGTMSPGTVPDGLHDGLPDGAEAALVTTASLTSTRGSATTGGPGITVIGVEEDSAYFAQDLTQGLDASSPERVLVSSALALRHGLEEGDALTIEEPDTTSHELTVAGVVPYPQSAVLTRLDQANQLLGNDPATTNAVMTSQADERLDAQARTVIDRSRLADNVDGLLRFMSGTTRILLVTAVALLVMTMFLLMRTVVDKSAYSITLLGALGYSHRETGRLYLDGFTLVTLTALAASLPASVVLMRPVWQVATASLPAAFEFTLPTPLVLAVIVIVLAAYTAVRLAAGLHLRQVDVVERLKDRQ